jgi:hypothetical protein
MISLKIPDEKGLIYPPSVPDAVAACRRYFMKGGRKTCTIKQDFLVYKIKPSREWDGSTLP